MNLLQVFCENGQWTTAYPDCPTAGMALRFIIPLTSNARKQNYELPSLGLSKHLVTAICGHQDVHKLFLSDVMLVDPFA